MVALLVTGCTSITPPDGPPYAGGGTWIVGAERAQALLRDGAVLLDARTDAQYRAGHLRGAVFAPWTRFSRTEARLRGMLLSDDDELGRRIGALGLSNGDRAVVMGDPIAGWGEDGRIVWMLRSLGLPSAVMVDGGHRALADRGLEISTSRPTPTAKTFTVKRDSALSISRDDLLAAVNAGQANNSSTALVDTREQREFDGATPYGEQRGGHVPGSVHLYFGSFINTFGYLRPRSTIEDRLRRVGLSPSRPVVAYCTGGVRSAWFVALLRDLGYTDVRNYAGSMWDWSAGPVDQFPLTR